MDIAICILVILLAVATGINQSLHKQIEHHEETIDMLEAACREKDAKIDILIKALGKAQITINEPRRR